ncbi:hypothetical protein TREMEDRAFT_74232 [Tremella mesenterica DSM 1558]|uniref:uncharacterized protein n=1 Tax=Tremella mesenterica (strain ATCC 24925 / CBS 8224 / DSM 1558 / NBRC 9311 / NRRL Y-6157 / RJB 2259-6 / UBC 559-6) TaxID=578456 RepID=UPI0003F48F7E|nr:uncharacterized protein TREMEDRAFT_74232 [Tremella mesenterica DSM 1558]EIW68296.1 hypothetical protein TREMEDRAFT_74232 [Tremella mesenterica DSM 1558]
MGASHSRPHTPTAVNPNASSPTLPLRRSRPAAIERISSFRRKRFRPSSVTSTTDGTKRDKPIKNNNNAPQTTHSSSSVSSSTSSSVHSEPSSSGTSSRHSLTQSSASEDTVEILFPSEEQASQPSDVASTMPLIDPSPSTVVEEGSPPKSVQNSMDDAGPSTPTNIHARQLPFSQPSLSRSTSLPNQREPITGAHVESTQPSSDGETNATSGEGDRTRRIPNSAVLVIQGLAQTNAAPRSAEPSLEAQARIIWGLLSAAAAAIASALLAPDLLSATRPSTLDNIMSRLRPNRPRESVETALGNYLRDVLRSPSGSAPQTLPAIDDEFQQFLDGMHTDLVGAVQAFGREDPLSRTHSRASSATYTSAPERLPVANDSTVGPEAATVGSAGNNWEGWDWVREGPAADGARGPFDTNENNQQTSISTSDRTESPRHHTNTVQYSEININIPTSSVPSAPTTAGPPQGQTTPFPPPTIPIPQSSTHSTSPNSFTNPRTSPQAQSQLDVLDSPAGRRLNFFRAHLFPPEPSSSTQSQAGQIENPNALIPCIFVGVRSITHDSSLTTDQLVNHPAFPFDDGVVPDSEETPRRSLRDRIFSRLGRRNQNSLNTYMVWVLGGWYPRNHPVLAIPSLLSGGPLTEEQIALVDQLLGRVKPPTVKQEEIDKSGLEVKAAKELMDMKKDERVWDNCVEKCQICLSEYEPEDKVRLLTCRHAFHQDCVDKWITGGRNSCPACRTEAVRPQQPGDTSQTHTRSEPLGREGVDQH